MKVREFFFHKAVRTLNAIVYELKDSLCINILLIILNLHNILALEGSCGGI